MAVEEQEEELEDERNGQTDGGQAESAPPSSGGSGRRGAAPPPDFPPPDPDDDPEDPRRVAHELVALAHAVITLAQREDLLSAWCPEDLQPAIRETRAGLALAAGQVHVEIASGQHDKGLMEAGIGGPMGRPKRKGFRRAVEGLCRLVGGGGRRAREAGEFMRGNRPMAVRAWLKSAASWGKTALDSISAEIPGGHVLKEGLELIHAAIDTGDAMATFPPPTTAINK